MADKNPNNEHLDEKQVDNNKNADKKIKPLINKLLAIPNEEIKHYILVRDENGKAELKELSEEEMKSQSYGDRIPIIISAEDASMF